MARSACSGGGVTVTAILMCRPDYFGVEYEINPWMHIQVQVDRELARRQWQALHTAYQDLGVSIHYTEPHQGLPDMVFSANAGVLWNKTAVLSSFHFQQRQGEEPHWRQALSDLGFAVHALPRSVSFEGAGDALFVGDRMFCGWGFRTDRESHAMVAGILGVEHVSLRLVDPRFYHLDTCFCPLNQDTALCAAEAFAPESLRLIRENVPHVIDVPVDVAAGFACNAMPLGELVVSSTAICRLEAELVAAGFRPMGLPMSEFMKSGGGVRCLSLPLDAGPGPGDAL